MSDNVRHPEHYTSGKIETIDFIRDKLGPEQFVGYCLGNVLKYVSRYDKKGTPVEDLEKAEVYLRWAIEQQKKIQEPELEVVTKAKAVFEPGSSAPREKENKKSKSGGVKKNVDVGKIKALRDAGWSARKIAGEVGCSEATVYNCLKKEK